MDTPLKTHPMPGSTRGEQARTAPPATAGLILADGAVS